MKKDTTKLTVGYQYRHMLIDHIIAVVVSMFIQLIAFGFMLEKNVLREIAGIKFTLLYFLMMYSTAGGFAKHDNKTYTQLQPDKKKGFFLGLMIAAITFVLFMGYKFVWANFSADGALQNWWSIVINVLFMVWTFPYFGLMNSVSGSITWYSTVTMFTVPVLASSLGYIAVCNKFDLLDKVVSFIYVKKDK